MYWVLTRRHIPTAMAKADSLVSQLDDSLVERPKPVTDLNPKVHPRLNQLVMQCVEIDPASRPANMKLVSDQLELIKAILAARGKPIVSDDEPAGV
jgi:hypothetical protein